MAIAAAAGPSVLYHTPTDAVELALYRRPRLQ
jgi:hypothetical protein